MKENREQRQNPSQAPQHDPRDDEHKSQGGIGQGREAGAGQLHRPLDDEQHRRRQGRQDHYETPPDEDEFSDREGS